MKNLNNFIPSFLNTSTTVSHALETTPCPVFIGNTHTHTHTHSVLRNEVIGFYH
jgi:hypothetical protein